VDLDDRQKRAVQAGPGELFIAAGADPARRGSSPPGSSRRSLASIPTLQPRPTRSSL